MSSTRDADRAKNVDSTTGASTLRQDDPTSPRVVNSATLLDGRSQLAILHNETVYFLRQTRLGKLILTK